MSAFKKYKVKITVLKRFEPSEVFEEAPVDVEGLTACSLFTDGQEFIVDESGKMPKGFCYWAWNDIFKAVTTLRFGGNFSWHSEKGVSVNCCTDGLRPVIFKLERIEDS